MLIFPGFLLLSVLSNVKVADRLLLSPGIGIALFVVISSGIASLWRYSCWPLLFVNVIVFSALLVIYFRTKDFRDDFKTIRRINFSREAFVFSILFFFLTIFAAWRLTRMELPGDVDGQGWGYLSLMIRMGGTINSFSPFYPEIKWLYSPGFFIVTAFLSDILSLPINYAMMGIIYFVWLMFFPVAFSVGRQFGDNKLGILICVFLIVGRGLFGALADSGYTLVLGSLMILLCFSTFFWALDTNPKKVGNVMIAGLTLSALCLSHPDSLIFFAMAEIPFFATIWLSRKQPNLQDYVVMLLIPGVAFLLTLPWLILQFPLFFNEVIVMNLQWRHEKPSWHAGIYMLERTVYFNGAIVILLAVLSMCYGSFRGKKRDVFLITWVLMIIDFSAFGIIDALASIFLPYGLSLHLYTNSLARRGPIVPFSILAAQFTHYIIKQKIFTNPKTVLIKNFIQLKKGIARLGPKGGALLIFSLITGLVFPLYAAPMLFLDARHTGGHFLFHWVGRSYAPFSTNDDLAAMNWIKNNTPEDVLILNSPYFDGRWVTIITERKTVFFTFHPYSTRLDPRIKGAEIFELNVIQAECELAFYHPDCDESRNIIFRYGISYVIVPDGKILGPPHVDLDSDAFDRANYLNLVFREGDAKVYRVINTRS